MTSSNGVATLNVLRDQVQAGIIVTDFAIARLQSGGVHSATTLLYDCVDTTATIGGRVPLRISRARREVVPWRTESLSHRTGRPNLRRISREITHPHVAARIGYVARPADDTGLPHLT